MKTPSICIIGPGVVGQATGKAFAAKGYSVAFYGGNPVKTKKLIEEGFSAYPRGEEMDRAYDFDISMLTVPTPTKNGKIDLSIMESAAIDLGKKLKTLNKYHLVVVKSTVPPGTTEELVIPAIEKYSGKKVGVDFGVCMNPEYLREISSYEDTLNAWFVLIGEYDKKSGDMLEAVYKGKFECPIHRCQLKEAEMQKYVHNLFNAAKIAFFNEMRGVANELGIDANKIFQYTTVSCEGMWSPRYGTKDLGPFQGECLPKDTQAFYHWATLRKYSVDLLKRVIDVNNTLMDKLSIRRFAFEEKPTL